MILGFRQWSFLQIIGVPSGGVRFADDSEGLEEPTLQQGGQDLFAKALCSDKDRSEEVLAILTYEWSSREDLVQHKRARSELQKLYAKFPDYEAVTARL